MITLPFSLYSTFVVEQKHGFNKQTIGLFFSDLFKSLLLGIVIGSPVIAGIVYIIQSTGSNFYFYVWGFMLLFQLLMVSIYPTLIQPLFNKFTPLEDGSLKKSIDALAQRIAFPLTKVFVVDGSKRSGHSNAYFFGFFKNKRIVLFDTLLEQNNEQETCAVLGELSLLSIILQLMNWDIGNTTMCFKCSSLVMFNRSSCTISLDSRSTLRLFLKLLDSKTFNLS